MLLGDSPHKGNFTYDAVLELTEQSIGEDDYGYRAEFLNLVSQALRIP